MESKTWDRRRFLKTAGLAGAAIPLAGGLVVAGCSEDSQAAAEKPVEYITPTPGNDAATATATAPAGGTPDLHTGHESMDEAHRKGIDLFLKNQTEPITRGEGNIPLEPRIENGVKVWDLTIDEIDWEVEPGVVEKARGYNGMIPGPVLRATEGDRVRINVKNNLPSESTSIHWHGMFVPNSMDGVTYINQDPITPGGTFVYEFTLRNSGTHMYHSHHNSMDQVNRGLLGAFIVDPKDPASYPAHDREYIMVLNDASLGYTINGKSFPATTALKAKKGERVVIRWLNEGIMNHPMHLHGMPMKVFAKDGWPLPQPYMCDTIDVAPGNRYDCLVEATEVGTWAFHCHILSHAESPQGMFGLVTVFIVEE
ncbi:MAG: multicopper oxidase domain-containing protein [Hyphomicrobiales bacterium]